MKCEQTRNQLQSLVERRVSDLPDDVKQHISECDDCRHASDNDRILAQSIPVWRDSLTSVDLTDSVIARAMATGDSSPLPKAPNALGLAEWPGRSAVTVVCPAFGRLCRGMPGGTAGGHASLR